MTEGQVITWHDGSGTKAGDVYIDSSDNLVIRNTSSVTERARIDSSGRLLLGTTTEGHDDADEITISGTRTGMTIRSANDDYGNIFFSDATDNSASEYIGAVQYYHADNSMRLKTSSTDRLVIDSSGNTTISSGNLVIGTSGKGIDFSATANSSATGATMSNELLDDYEEGSWTPQIRKYVSGSFGTAAGMADNGTVQRSKYTKIGDMVTVHLHWNGFQVSDANYAALGGLPFNTTTNGGGGGSVGYTNALTSNQNLGVLVGADGDNMYFYINNNQWNGWSTSSNRDIYVTVSYFTS